LRRFTHAGAGAVSGEAVESDDALVLGEAGV
jgi:hypothetical protein